MGVSTESGLLDELNGSELWTYEIQGGGIPVVAGNTVHRLDISGAGEEVEESYPSDSESGQMLCGIKEGKILSATLFMIATEGSACVDPETALSTSPGCLLDIPSVTVPCYGK